MPLISSDTIRDISVKSVEMFLNDKVPLSEGLAKQASAYELNSEQIQRAVEATNSIAYLKVLELANDRTVEFPLCKYAEVMTSIVIPEMDKQASITVHKSAAVGKTTLDMEKFATYVAPTLESREQLVHMTKMASIAARELQGLKDRAVTIVPEIEKTASLIKADPQGLEKLATIVNGDEFRMLSKLVYGSEKEHSDTGLFKAAELKTVEKIAGLLKEAKEVRAGIQKREALVERSDHVKQAAVNLAGGAGVAIGRGIGSVAAAPVRPLAAAAKGTAQNITNKGKAFATKAENFLTGSNKPIPSFAAKKGLGTVAKGLGLAALDTTLYQPGTTRSGNSKDVWDALQRS